MYKTDPYLTIARISSTPYMDRIVKETPLMKEGIEAAYRIGVNNDLLFRNHICTLQALPHCIGINIRKEDG